MAPVGSALQYSPPCLCSSSISVGGGQEVAGEGANGLSVPVGLGFGGCEGEWEVHRGRRVGGGTGWSITRGRGDSVRGVSGRVEQEGKPLPAIVGMCCEASGLCPSIWQGRVRRWEWGALCPREGREGGFTMASGGLRTEDLSLANIGPFGDGGRRGREVGLWWARPTSVPFFLGSTAGIDMCFLVSRFSVSFPHLQLACVEFFTQNHSGDSYNRGYKIDSSIFGADPGVTQSKSSEASPRENEPTPAYRCKKCRRVVALQENVVGHTPGKGETCFEWSKRSSGPFDRRGETECSSIFVEPLRWMTTVEEGAMEGKLSCIHCEARLGYFNWAGIQCSCGSWITPAFQIHKSRVDVSTV
ncbi:hypothetical protein Taro_024295 [Colocasia esculenta]|uniref:protein-tyrosine-phosphatase n=1 Tax=Colocasia esculenta TaxID=4460 RepID=A0A843V8Z3_COLES|nr:hypothetical protein [Colocasia esculenta]